MNKNIIRIAVAALTAGLVFTAIFLLLKTTALAVAAYLFSLLAVIEVAVAFSVLASGVKRNFIVNAAFPLVVWEYAVANVVLSAVFLLLEYFGMPLLAVFSVLQIILLACLIFRLLAMDAARDAVCTVENNVAAKTMSWKMLCMDAEALLNETTGENRAAVGKLFEEIRYADPVSDPALEQTDRGIADGIRNIKNLCREHQDAAAQTLSMEVRQLVQDRNNRAKLLK